MSKLLQAYTRSFERQPYLTLLITNGVLMSLGDFSAQALGSLTSIAETPPPYDVIRTMRYAVFGSSMGPLGGAWHRYLEIRFPLRPVDRAAPIRMTKVKVEDPSVSPIPGMKLPAGARLERGSSPASPVVESATAGGNVSWVALGKRLAADQLGMAPVSLFIFLFSMALLEGLDAEETYDKIRTNFVPIILVNWQVWPILQLVSFRYIPLRYRVPFASVCGIAWTVFLSLSTSGPRQVKEIA